MQEPGVQRDERPTQLEPSGKGRGVNATRPQVRDDTAPGETTGAGEATRTRIVRWIGPAIVVVLLFLALHVLRGELREYGYHQVARAVRAIPTTQLLAALAFTLLSYVVLPAYDALGLAYAGRTGEQRVRPRRIWFGAATAYGLSQTLGFPALTGSAVRFRMWTSWGLTSAQVARAATFAGATFSLGVALVAGLALLIEPAATLARARVGDGVAIGVGAALVTVVAGFVLWSILRGGRTIRAPEWLARRLPAGRWELPVPRARVAAAQLAVVLLDWGSAAAVLYTLLPRPTPIGFVAFTGAFVIAQFAGLVSHVPGGLGVFDTLIVLLLAPHLAPGQVLASVIAYRAIYYLLPFAAAVTSLAIHEAQRNRARLGAMFEIGAAHVTVAPAPDVVAGFRAAAMPLIASVATFAAGALLLWSGATPGVRERLTALDVLLPIGVIELSHLVGSIIGSALLVLAWALRRRIGAAWGMTIGLLAAGIVASLLKGFDWEEAIVLTLVLALLLPSRAAFYRRSALTAEPLEPGWIVAIIAVVGSSIWLGLFSYRHLEYASDLWWRVSTHGDAPRFLRASVASSGALMMFGLWRLLRHAPPEPQAPDTVDLSHAAAIAAHATSTEGFFALLGDKMLLFDNDTGAADETLVASAPSGFVQYAVSGRSWVALGDPVVAGPDADRIRTDLAWRFKAEADRHGGWPVFYQVCAATLPLYIDLGLSFLKLGEEARVPLASFSLEGGMRKGLRRVVKDVEQAGGSFEVLPAERVPEVMGELRAVSDDWLARKAAREKGFSLGFFDERYLRHFPIAVVRAPREEQGKAGAIVAFANVLCGGEHHELSADLMRFSEDAPKNVMDYLFIRLMLWGREQGFHWFNLGMAPLAGLEARQLAPLWARAGAWLFRHGEHFYNYQGLRQYKEKFDPVWEPRYLASPGGLALPRILANVASLISGGLTGIVRK